MRDIRPRVAIVGAGMVARVHADAARRAGARLIGVSASTPERSRDAAREFGAELEFTDSESMVTAAEVDIVHVCAPNHLHRGLTEQALRAGKHVVCEKPLATSVVDARAMTELAASAGTVTAVPFVYRYHPMAAEARARVRGTALGDVRLIHGHYLQDWLAESTDTNWRVDEVLGGPSRAFADIGSHWCDLVEWVTGHRIAELAATTSTVVSERVGSGSSGATRPVLTEDAVNVVFRTDGGATGALVVSQVSPGRKNRLWFEVDGARASVTFDQENPESLLVANRRGTEVVAREAGFLSAEAGRLSVLPAGHPMGYHDCFAGFVRDVYATVRGESRPRSLPTFDDALRTAVITEAVLASARSRSWTEVSS